MAVRRERVVLELEDRFSGPLGRPIAATRVLDKSLNDLDKTSVRTDRDMDRLASGGLAKTAVQSRNVTREVDRMSGRLRLFADVAAILGPALVPIGAVALPAITGLATQFGAATLAAGTAAVAFQGFGAAFDAVNKAAIEPTAENLEEARIAMQNLGPEARSLVTELQDMRPAFLALRNAAAAGLFPGLESALGELDGALPRVERVLFAIGNAAGGVADELAEGIAGPRGREFLRFVKDEVPNTLTDLGRIVGNLAGGMAELWMAFTPLNQDFSAWMLDASRSFDRWARGLAQTEGFEDFVAYIRENGPHVADAMGAVGNAVLQIVEASAPLGGPVLKALEAVADAIGAIAGSDAGPAIMATVTALALLSRGMKTFEAVSRTSWGTAIKGAETFGQRVAASRGLLARGAAGLAGVALASSDVADSFALGNTASMALMGTLAGPWGAAVGAAVGLTLDLSRAQGSFEVSADDLAATLDKQTGAITRNTSAYVANELERQGVLRAAQDLGLNLSDVTQAALGDADALDRVNLSLEKTKAGFYDANGYTKVGTVVLEEFKDNMYAVTGAIDTTGEKLNGAQSRIARVAEATGEAARGFRQAESAAQQFRNAIESLNRLLEGRAALRDYEAALDAFTKGLKENGRSFDINTEKGRLNQQNLDNIAATLARVVEGMKGSERQGALRQARADIRALRADGKLTEGQMDFLLRAVQRLDQSSANPKLEADSSAALNAIGSVAAKLSALDGDSANVTVTTTYQTIGRPAGSRDWDTRHGVAEGGTIPGPRYPYGDKVLAMLAPGEEVITNRHGEADRFRADRAAGRIPAYAGGGQVAGEVAAMNRAARSGFSRPSAVNVNMGGEMRVRGTLNTPWGPAEIEGIAVRAANGVVNAQLSHDDLMGRRPR